MKTPERRVMSLMLICNIALVVSGFPWLSFNQKCRLGRLCYTGYFQNLIDQMSTHEMKLNKGSGEETKKSRKEKRYSKKINLLNPFMTEADVI